MSVNAQNGNLSSFAGYLPGGSLAAGHRAGADVVFDLVIEAAHQILAGNELSRSEMTIQSRFYIENYYNSVRMHGTLGNMSPMQYESIN